MDNNLYIQKTNEYPTIVTAGAHYLDIDAYACMVALAELLRLRGQNAVAWSDAAYNYSVCPSLVEDGQIMKALPAPEWEKNGRYIIVDVSDPEYLKKAVPLGNVVAVYDHHVGFEEYWESRIGENARIEFIGAAAGDRFRVELHAFNRECLVANAHDVAVGSAGGHFEIRRERRFVNNQAVVTREDVLLADGAEKSLAVQVNFFGDAVLDELGLHNLCAEGVTDGLVTEANAQNRELARKVLDGFHGDAGIFGAARARAHDKTARVEFFDVGDGAFAATEHADFFVSDLGKRLVDVVSKRVVVVDDDDHFYSLF